MTAAPLDLEHRFDAEAAWAALPEPARAAIGAASLARLASDALYEHAVAEGDERLERVASAAMEAAESELERLLGEVAIPGFEAPSGAPRIPAGLGMVCRECGCTEEDACPEGCGWAEANLCTACRPMAA